MFRMVWIRISIPSFLSAILAIITFLAAFDSEAAVRIKDITTIHNENEIDLIGYGLIVGLDGTGDGKGSPFTQQSMANMMERLGLTVDSDELKIKNVAAVMVTGRLSSADRPGSRIDVVVSSIGDAKSLAGGTLLLTPLASSDGEVYVSAQGPVSIGGFNVQVDPENRIVNNYTLVGRVSGGGKILRRLDKITDNGDILLTLVSPDYTTATRIAQEVNNKYGLMALIEDQNTIRITVPDSLSYYNERMHLIADIGKMRIEPDQKAKVVINERTGTIVTGEHVTIAPVAIAHGNMTVSIKAYPSVSQPQPFSGGETKVVSEYDVSVEDEVARVMHTGEIVSLADIANALNLIGATPRDIVAIFQALKEAGALRAELVVM